MTETPEKHSVVVRLGAFLIRWRPWPDLVFLIGGGILVVLNNLRWDRPEDPIRLGIGVIFGIAMIAVGALVAVLWPWRSGDPDQRHPAQPN